MKAWTCALLSAALLGGAAGAQEAACPGEESLLEVRVGASVRGSLIVRAEGDRFWLPAQALRPGEEGYADAEVRCEGAALIRLRPELAPTLDPETLTLRVRAAPELLGTRVLPVTPGPPEPLPSRPLFGLNYRLAGSTDGRGGWAGTGDVQVFSIRGPWSFNAGVRQTLGTPGTPVLTPSGQVRYQPGRGWSAQVVYNSPSELGAEGTLFSGVQVEGEGGQGRFWPELRVVLPLEATLRLWVNGRLLNSWRSPPGTVLLRRIPLAGSRGLIVVEVEDDAGRRSVAQPYTFAAALLPVGGYAGAAEAGWLDGRPALGARGRFGLGPDVTLEGQGMWQPGDARADLGLLWVPAGSAWQLGLAVTADEASAGQVQFGVRARAALAAPPWGLGASLGVPLGGGARPSAGVFVSYEAPQFGAQVQVEYGGATGGLTARVQGDVHPSSAWTLRPSVAYGDGRWRVGLGATFNLGEKVSGALGGQVGPGSSWGASAGITYRPDDRSQVRLSASPREAAVGYRYNGAVQAEVVGRTSGSLGARVQGGVTWVEGRASFGAAGERGAFVVLETGLPGVGISAAGRYQGETDAEGRLVVPASPRATLRLRVDLDRLPLTVTVGSPTREVTLPGAGAYVVDWRDNFIRSRFVDFTWSGGQPAAEAELRLEDGTVVALDRFGTGFLPDAAAPLGATLRSADGRQCAVLIPPGAEAATCTPGPIR